MTEEHREHYQEGGVFDRHEACFDVEEERREIARRQNAIRQRRARLMMTEERLQKMREENAIRQREARHSMSEEKRHQLRAENAIRQRVSRLMMPEERRQKIREENAMRQRMNRSAMSEEQRRKLREENAIRQRVNRLVMTEERRQELRKENAIRQREARLKMTDMEFSKDPTVRQGEVMLGVNGEERPQEFSGDDTALRQYLSRIGTMEQQNHALPMDVLLRNLVPPLQSAQQPCQAQDQCNIENPVGIKEEDNKDMHAINNQIRSLEVNEVVKEEGHEEHPLEQCRL